jgi:aspartyl-tRNA(Asn)/glutamyl-tRNA(Gln) amidotransferase subunit C
MALNENDVARIARLARIELTPERRAHALQELNGMLHIIERLQQEDTTGVEPLAHPLSAHEDVALRLREDRVAETGTEAGRQDLMRNAPEARDGLFLVPKVLE